MKIIEHDFEHVSDLQWARLGLSSSNARSDYKCKKCGMEFSHYYHIEPDIYKAFKESGLPKECKNRKGNKGRNIREIKFRIWDKKDKKMIYSGAIDNKEFKGEIYLSLSGEISIFVDEDGGKDGLWEHEIEYEKDRFILMQYTGTIDNNYKEIYEGDILKSEVEQKYQETHGFYDIHKVFFNEVELRFEAEPALPITWGGYKKREIIGNIYENPELLEEGK